MGNTEIKKILQEAKSFAKEFCSNILGTEMTNSAKQVYFLDNQKKVKETLESLNNIKSTYDSLGIELEGEDQQCYELSVGLANSLLKCLADYKNSYAGINPNVTVEETTVVVNEDTVKEAAKNNSSTQKIIKDMNELNEKANISQVQEFTHAILAGKKFMYVKVATTQELNALVNEAADANPNEKVSVYEVQFNPIPLKKKTVYTV